MWVNHVRGVDSTIHYVQAYTCNSTPRNCCLKIYPVKVIDISAQHIKQSMHTHKHTRAQLRDNYIVGGIIRCSIHHGRKSQGDRGIFHWNEDPYFMWALRRCDLFLLLLLACQRGWCTGYPGLPCDWKIFEVGKTSVGVPPPPPPHPPPPPPPPWPASDFRLCNPLLNYYLHNVSFYSQKADVIKTTVLRYCSSTPTISSGIHSKVVVWIPLSRVDSIMSKTKWSLIWLLKELISTPAYHF